MKALGSKRKQTGEKPPVPRTIYGNPLPGNTESENKGGAPEKINLEMIDTICKYVTIGCNMDTACRAAGIDNSTLSKWSRIAKEQPASIYSELFRKVAIAIAEAEARDLSIIERAAMGAEREYKMNPDGTVMLDKRGKPVIAREEIKPDVRSAMWRLERRFPNKWGPKAQLTLDDDREKPIDVTPVEPAKLAAELQDLAETLNAISKTKGK
jgi:hypothetical protein